MGSSFPSCLCGAEGEVTRQGTAGQRLPAPSWWVEVARRRELLGHMGTLRTPPGPGGAAKIQGTQEALHFWSVTGTSQQGGYRGETASSAPDFAHKGMEGWKCTHQGRADACPGPTTTTHLQSFLQQPSFQPLCSFCFLLSSSGEHWPFSDAPRRRLG